MNLLNIFLKNNIKYNLINKFFYKDIKKLPVIKSVTLHIVLKNADLKLLAASLLSFEILTGKKGKLLRSKKPNIFLKIRKGQPIGCFVKLSSKSLIYFLSRIVYDTMLKSKMNSESFIKTTNVKNTISFAIKDLIIFDDLERHYHIFNKLNNLNVNIVTTAACRNEFLFLLFSLKLL